MGGQRLVELVELTPTREGVAELHIPPQCLWDCVECCAEHRLEASFTFKPPLFVARLPTVSVDRAREILRDWALLALAENFHLSAAGGQL